MTRTHYFQFNAIIQSGDSMCTFDLNMLTHFLMSMSFRFSWPNAGGLNRLGRSMNFMAITFVFILHPLAMAEFPWASGP